MKRPAFQFYPADWRNDAALRMCSLAVRGLWWEMICIMHTAEPYGHLVAAGQPISPEELARIVGESRADVVRWLAELERRKVYSVTPDGAIYSRRMVRDENERDKWRKRQARHRDVTPDVTPLSPLSSSSSSSSSSDLNPIVGLPPDAPPPEKRKNGNGAYTQDAENVLNYLNKATGKGFDFRNRVGELTASAEKIIARLKQGYTPTELREVVFAKTEQWKDDEKYAEYLRPSTLFGKEKFEQYIGELKHV